MTVQHQARAVLARIGKQTGVISPGLIDNPRALPERANAGPAGYRANRRQLIELQAKPVAELREIASAAVEQAKSELSKASGVDWYAGLLVRVVNYGRWRPVRVLVESAQESLELGDGEASDADKKTRYVRAWETAQEALASTAIEAVEGTTDLTMLGKEGFKEAGKHLPDPDLSWIPWLVGGVVVLTVLRR